MKKGILIIGKKALVNRAELNRIFAEEIGTNRESLTIDKIDNQVLFLDGIDERLKVDSFRELIQPFWGSFSRMKILVSLESFELLSKEDLKFAQENFDIRFNLYKNEYVQVDENEMFVEGIPVRLYMLQSSPSTPQFFIDSEEKALMNALTVLKRLYGGESTLEQLQELLYNPAGCGERMISEAMKKNSEGHSEENQEMTSTVKGLRDSCHWFKNDYFTGAKGSKTATKTYDHCLGLRLFVDKLVLKSK